VCPAIDNLLSWFILMTMKRLRISAGGQVSVPAAVRNRWKTRVVVADDRGDHLILRPAPEDPIEAARGAFKDYPGPSPEEALRQFREEEREAEERKWGPGPA
jgi:bifunctional DNA-binding transcriptional regulator/antitoxin component of YhaV-PrlF toxin-antitoxin module